MSLTTQDLEATIHEHLVNLFEVEPAKINRDARLFEDLELDSIDAVDLVVQLQEVTGRRFKPEEFKGVRTVGDIIDRIQSILET
jgi:acyl carrier protein